EVLAFRFPYRGEKRIVHLQRLIGLPGEHVAIHRGKLYVLAENGPDDPPPPKEEREPAWTVPLPPHPRSIALFQQGKFTLLRKPPGLAWAMRQLVYDADHPGLDLPEEEAQRWALAYWAGPEKGKFVAGENGATMTYRHVLRGSGGVPRLITPF